MALARLHADPPNGPFKGKKPHEVTKASCGREGLIDCPSDRYMGSKCGVVPWGCLTGQENRVGKRGEGRLNCGLTLSSSPIRRKRL